MRPLVRSRLTRLVLVALTSLPLVTGAVPAKSTQASAPRPRDVRALALSKGFTALEPAEAVRPALVALGRSLAFDKVLSGNRDIACMSCHMARFGTSDGRRLARGAHGGGAPSEPDGARRLPRNTPSLFVLGDVDTLFLDGRVAVLEDGSFDTPAGQRLTPAMTSVFEFGALSAVPLFPVAERGEMRGFAGSAEAEASGNELAALGDDDLQGVWDALMRRLGEIPAYREAFETAYPGTAFEDMTFAHASNAIAGFIVDAFGSSNTPWDRFLRGDDHALDEQELVGAQRFLDAACSECHAGPRLTDDAFHNVALAQFGPGMGQGEGGHDDLGRFAVSGRTEDRYAFRTPSLRNVERTGPYGHAGQFDDLRAFVAHYSEAPAKLRAYDGGSLPEALRSTLIDDADRILATMDPLLEPVRFDDATIDAITAFLQAFTDDPARALVHVAPSSVPSGLPVDR